MQKISSSSVPFLQSLQKIIPNFLERTTELREKIPSFLAKTAILSYCLQAVAAQKSNDQSNDFSRNVGYAALSGIIAFVTGTFLFGLSICCCRKEKRSQETADDYKTSGAQEFFKFLMIGGIMFTFIFGLMYLISSAYPELNTTKNR